MKNVWYKRMRPVVGLAPMDGVTDVAFREIAVRYGRPDVMFTEFTSVDGLRAGATRLLRDLLYTDDQHPLVAQLFGSDPDAFYMAAVICAELGFDGIDINMGCPSKNVTVRGAGASLIREPELAREIIQASRKGLQDWSDGLDIGQLPLPAPLLHGVRSRSASSPTSAGRRMLPLTVKTRIGYAQQEVESWIGNIAMAHPDAVTVHGRTFKQLYSGSADWDAIGAASDRLAKEGIPALGNGDVAGRGQAERLSHEYRLHGVLIGRAAMGNPWVFLDAEPSPRQKLEVALEHCRLYSQLLPDEPYVAVRKHLIQYTKGMEGASELRAVLMGLSTYNDTERYIRTVIDSL